MSRVTGMNVPGEFLIRDGRIVVRRENTNEGIEHSVRGGVRIREGLRVEPIGDHRPPCAHAERRELHQPVCVRGEGVGRLEQDDVLEVVLRLLVIPVLLDGHGCTGKGNPALQDLECDRAGLILVTLLALGLTSTASAGLLDGGGQETCYGIPFDGMCLTPATVSSQLKLGTDEFLELVQCTDDAEATVDGCVELTIGEVDGDVLVYTLWNDPCFPIAPLDGTRVFKAC